MLVWHGPCYTPSMAKRIHYTLEQLHDAALNHKTRGAFLQQQPLLYKAASKRKILNTICAHMPPHVSRKLTTPERGWTPATILADALQYTTRSSWWKGNNWAYAKAKELQIFEQCVQHMQPAWNQYSLETCQVAALRFKTRGMWQRHEPRTYQAALRHGWLEQCAAHMPIHANSVDEEEYFAVASQVESRTELWETYPGVALWLNRHGHMDAACAHMKTLSGTSKGERELLSWLQMIVPDFKPARFKNRQSLDCYSESLKLGVEYNGLYHHSVEGGRNRRYHLDKTKHFETLGIRIIHVWEHEWRDRQAQIKNYLRSACRANTIRVGARKCMFKEISNTQARQFLAAAHIQGAPRSITLALGCFYESELISVSTYGPHHRNNCATASVLNRFACKSDYTISGALAKMSQLAFNKLGPLASWADRCKSRGSGYLAAGWRICQISGPDYFYATTTARYVSKQSRQKSKVNTPTTMTEGEHARQDGLYKIWDCGKLVLEFKPT